MVSHHTSSAREAQHVLNVQAFAGSVAPLAVCSLAGLADDGAHGQCEIFDDIDAGSTVSYIQIDSAWRSKLQITRTVSNSWTSTSSMKPLENHWVHSSKLFNSSLPLTSAHIPTSIIATTTGAVTTVEHEPSWASECSTNKVQGPTHLHAQNATAGRRRSMHTAAYPTGRALQSRTSSCCPTVTFLAASAEVLACIRRHV